METNNNLSFFDNELYIEDWQNAGYKLEAISYTQKSSRVRLRLHYPYSNLSEHGKDF